MVPGRWRLSAPERCRDQPLTAWRIACRSRRHRRHLPVRPRRSGRPSGVSGPPARRAEHPSRVPSINARRAHHGSSSADCTPRAPVAGTSPPRQGRRRERRSVLKSAVFLAFTHVTETCQHGARAGFWKAAPTAPMLPLLLVAAVHAQAQRSACFSLEVASGPSARLSTRAGVSIRRLAMLAATRPPVTYVR